jgi:hypothetical protein
MAVPTSPLGASPAWDDTVPWVPNGVQPDVVDVVDRVVVADEPGLVVVLLAPLVVEAAAVVVVVAPVVEVVAPVVDVVARVAGSGSF